MMGPLTVRLYNAVWRAGLPLIRRHLDKRAHKGKEDPSRLAERYGRGYQSKRPEGRLIWLHAVSVGESVSALNLCRAMAQNDRSCQFLVSVNTITAAAFIQREVERSTGDLPLIQIYQPLDHPESVTAFLEYWQPDLAVFMESDFWYNLITLTKARAIPVIFASSQLSDKAYANWMRFKRLAADLFGAADLILPVDHKQAGYFSTLQKGKAQRQPDQPDINVQDFGVQNIGVHNIRVLGSLKMDIRPPSPDTACVAALKKAANGRPIILAASTHDGEEALFLEALARLKRQDFFCVIAPRHPVRAQEVMALLPQDTRRFSQDDWPMPGDRAYLLDGLGQMDSLFAAADLVLMGGSFAPLGGHNPLEPAAAGVPVICGPHLFKNQADYDALIAAGQIRKLIEPQAEDITKAVETALGDDGFSKRAAEAGPAYVAEACLRPHKAADYILAVLETDSSSARADLHKVDNHAS